MALLLVPVLAQALTVQVGDRAELRRRFDADTSAFEVENGAQVAARLSPKNSSLSAYYAPSILVTPLESLPRETVIFHRVGAEAALTWKVSRRTTITASQEATYDQINTRLQALSAPLTVPELAEPTPDPQQPGSDPQQPGSDPQQPGSDPQQTGSDMPPTDPAMQPLTSPNTDIRTSSSSIEIGAARTELTLNHLASRDSTVSTLVGYGFSTGLFGSRNTYPFVQGPDAELVYTTAVSLRNELSTTAIARYAFSSEGERAVIATLGESWRHRITRYAITDLGVGASYVWTDPADGPPEQGIVPGAGARAALAWVGRVYGGQLTVSVGAGYGPVLDQATFRPDARLGVSGRVSWTKRRLTLYTLTSGTLSAEPDDPGALNSVFASAGATYDLGAGFQIEGGARAAWQSFEQEEIVRPSAALFVALAWDAIVIGR